MDLAYLLAVNAVKETLDGTAAYTFQEQARARVANHYLPVKDHSFLIKF